MFKLFAILFYLGLISYFEIAYPHPLPFFFFFFLVTLHNVSHNIYKNLKYGVKYYIPEIWKPEIRCKTFKTCPLLSGIP